ncbi:MAG: patatin [Cytophagia bacterium]|nr:MAG: patatin [Cytophagales bacterium]TAG34539.1 MAG: patatin [Cytophagia bacterium]TAG76684.1 MAG: patatin [Cytophagales bacterium]
MLRWLFILGWLLIANGTTSAQTTKFRNLVFEGGGIKGIAYGGALQAMSERGLLDSVQRVGGTSVGAITAVLLAVGYSPKEIIETVSRLSIKQFNDGSGFFVGGSRRLVKNFGWYRGERFTQWLQSCLKAKTGLPNLTFAQLHAYAGAGGFRDLYVTGTNLTQQRTEVFSHETYPQMRVVDAVRISMSIPFYFRAVFLDSTAQVVQKVRPGQRINVFVDGGVAANFPLFLFDSTKYILPHQSPNRFYDNPETLGFRLVRSEQLNSPNEPAPYRIDSFGSYVGAFYNMVISGLNLTKPSQYRRVVSINSLNFSPKIKHIPLVQKLKLIKSGQDAVEQFFSH